MRKVWTLLTIVGFLAGSMFFAGTAFSADGAKLYKKCQGCHSKDGKGKAKKQTPDFTNADWQSRHSLDKIKKVIAEGMKKTETKSGKAMPGFSKRMSAEEIDTVAKYVKAFSK